MAMILSKRIRALLVRNLAGASIVITYILASIAPQVLTVAGISALGVTVATPAKARRRYRRRHIYGYWPYRRWRRVSPL
jgi:hypothetical protein